MTINANARDYDDECTKFVGLFDSFIILQPVYEAMIDVGRNKEA